jgi:hypothetical protein
MAGCFVKKRSGRARKIIILRCLPLVMDVFPSPPNFTEGKIWRRFY